MERSRKAMKSTASKLIQVSGANEQSKERSTTRDPQNEMWTLKKRARRSGETRSKKLIEMFDLQTSANLKNCQKKNPAKTGCFKSGKKNEKRLYG
jgi:hypothetical protein